MATKTPAVCDTCGHPGTADHGFQRVMIGYCDDCATCYAEAIADDDGTTPRARWAPPSPPALPDTAEPARTRAWLAASLDRQRALYAGELLLRRATSVRAAHAFGDWR